jgi:hypothetical protein
MQNLGKNYMRYSKSQVLNFPFDFCRIERSSRILGCDSEDILNWASTGEIKLYSPFFNQETTVIHLSAIDVERLEEEGQLTKRQGRFSIELNEVSRLVINEKEFDDKALKSFCDDSIELNAILEGYWRISEDQLRKIYFEQKYEFEYYEILLINLNIIFGLSLPTPIQVKKTINVNTMYLSKDGALKIFKHLNGKSPFNSMFNHKDEVKKQISHKQENEDTPSIERLRRPTAQLVHGLLQLHYGVDNPILYSSPKLHEDISQKFASKGIEANIMQLRAFEDLMVKIREK